MTTRLMKLTLAATSSIVSMTAMALVLAPSAFAQDTGIDEVVVTAQKRSQSVQDVPITISAFDADDIEALGITSSGDIAPFVSNLEIGLPSGRGNQPLISIRGVGLNDFNTNNSGPNGIYVDEVYISSPSAQTFAVFDLERIEVLKGPQGTLYGRNTTGGAINYIAAKPTDDLSVTLRQSIASFSTYQTEGAVSGPLGDRVKGRLAFSANSSDGFSKNLLTGEDVNGAGDFAGRGIVTFDPTDKLSLRLTVQGGKVDTLPTEYRFLGATDGAGGVCTTPQIVAGQCVDAYGYGGASDFYDGSYNRREHLRVDSLGGSLRADYDFAGATLTSITAYDTNDKLHPEDTDTGPLRLLEIDYGVESKTFTQELRLAGGNDARHWLAGLYFLDEKLDQDQSVFVFLDLDTLLGAGAGDGVSQIGRSINNQKTRSYAAFGQTDFAIAEDLRLTLGARYTSETKDFDAHGQIAFQGVGAGSGVMGPFADIFAVKRDISDDAFSGRIALDWKPAENTLVFGSVSTGYKSGGFNGGFLSSDPTEAIAQLNPIRPETVIAYEAGFKWDGLDNRLRVNGAVFYYDYTDLQVFNLIPAVPGGTGFPVQVLDNAESATIEGAELEVIAQPTENLTLSANLGLLDAKVGHFVTGAGEDFTDNRLALSPKLKFSGVANYRIPLASNGEINLQASASYRGDQFFDIRNDPLLQQEAYWLVDARIGYETPNGRWSVAAFGRNLTGEKYVNFAVNLTSTFGLLQQTVGAPRVGGVEVAYRY